MKETNRSKILINDKKMYEFFAEIANDHTFWTTNVGIKCNEGDTENYGFSISSYIDVYKTLNNLQLLYCKEEAIQQIGMVENLQSIFNKYFKIPGLERLITTNYTDIEWSMFLEQNFEKNEPKRTRDHFKHQFRNAFLGCKLLYDFHFVDNILKCIQDKETLFSYLINSSSYKHTARLRENNSNIQEKEDYEKEIIFKSYILAAIFHDVGYPIEYYLRESRQIHRFTPFYKIINSDIKTDFVEIKAMLVDSQLFSIIDNKDIEKKYSKDDHGVFSAISFLLNFYQAGSIFSMSDIDRCIIEIAAIAIYNHTNKYKDNERMIFNNDPISFLLRLCDDLQEWSRFSLSVDNTGNMLRCKCLGMIKRCENDKVDKKNSDIKYVCQSCSEEFYKVSALEYKKIHYLSLCDEMEISKSNNIINIDIKYDEYKQMELLLCDYTSAKYRNDDLKKVKEMLKFQKNLPNINIKWFLSNNPCELARRILGFIENQIITEESLFEKTKLDVQNKKLLGEFVTEINKPREYGDKEIETDLIKYCGKAQDFVFKFIGLIKAFRESICENTTKKNLKDDA